MKIALSAFWRHEMEPRLPADVEAVFFQTVDEAVEAVKGAKMVQLDLLAPEKDIRRVIEAGDSLEWIAVCFAGVDRYPLDLMESRGIRFTNGVGLVAVPVAEWAVMGVYALAKGFAGIVRMHDRKEWGQEPYGTIEVSSAKALLIGYGHIGKEIARQLRGIGTDVTVVRSKPDPTSGVLGPDDWRAKLGDYDFVILAAPGTEENEGMIGAAELKAMKKTAHLINIGRGSLIDQAAFRAAMDERQIAGALLDPATPEPLPKDDPLWDAPDTIVTAHLSGRSQTTMPARVTDLLLKNLEQFRQDKDLINLVDTERGY